MDFRFPPLEGQDVSAVHQDDRAIHRGEVIGNESFQQQALILAFDVPEDVLQQMRERVQGHFLLRPDFDTEYVDENLHSQVP